MNYDEIIKSIKKLKDEYSSIIILQQDNDHGPLDKGFPELKSIIRMDITKSYDNYELIEIEGLKVRVN